ncbi:unnamed protein product [Mytilus coruscus]|uniref:RNase H type-1 domain-containing protein n=1 Tax=Mytilus coruscus TaxID=42192 RepID=A0A6J8AIL2_MYTCO|nr:unnamed protein product [Mytilus coruscus]
MDLVQQISVSAVRSKDIGGEIVPKLSKLPVVSSETDINDKYYLDSPLFCLDNEDCNLTLDSKLYEYENKSFKNRCSVKGRLKSHISYWKNIGASEFVLDILENGYFIPFISTPPRTAGFVVNIAKSTWTSCQELIWLGLKWNSKDYSIQITEDRIKDLISNIEKVSNKLPGVTARNLARIAGRIISMSPVLGNVTRIITRQLYKLIESRSTWDTIFRMTDQEIIGELMFWRKNVHSLNFKHLSEYKIPSVIMYSDASNFAAGAYSACQLDNTVFHKMWTDMEKKQNSTWGELKAIESCLDTLKTKLESKIVKWFTDNQNCVRIIQCGSRKQELHSLAMSIFSICLHRSISIDIQWIPRNLNTEADSISKIFDFDDWECPQNFLSI